MKRHWKRCRSFGVCCKAVSAIEFAMVLPVMILLLLAGAQLVLYINATRKIERIATSISEMISQATPPNNSTTSATVNQLDLHFSYDATLALFPYIMSDAASKNIPWWSDISIDYASINFIQTVNPCNVVGDQSSCYMAKVVWTSTGTAGSKYRPCIVPQLPANDNAAPSPTTLPRSLFGPGSIIAIDVSFNFVPTFGAKFIPPITISRSVYVQPRYASLINFDPTGNDGIATICP